MCSSHGDMSGISEDAARCWAKPQNSKVVSLPTLGMPYSGPIERTRFLRGPGTRCCVVARQAGWWGPEGWNGKAIQPLPLAEVKESHPLVQTLLAISISHMTNDSIEEVFQGSATRVAWRVHFFHHQICGFSSISIDLESVGMDDSLAPLRVWKLGVEWCWRAGRERHNWYWMTGVPGSWQSESCSQS